MKNKNKIIIRTWIIGNIILIGLYIIHMIGIQCEPCIDPNNCPPCQTDYMKKFPWIIAAFNGLAGLYWIINRKKNNDTPTMAKKTLGGIVRRYLIASFGTSVTGTKLQVSNPNVS